MHHEEHGLTAVERVAAATPGLAHRLLQRTDLVSGAVVLATCNRVEIYVDAVTDDPARLDAHVRAELAAGDPDGDVPSWQRLDLTTRTHTEVLWHLFSVGAGLDSMVVGEREIAGQLRRALKQARAEKTATYLLAESIEQALRTSRKVAHLTSLASTGRSVVSVGLDMLRLEWPGRRVLLLGTGSYAGATVAALRARGCDDIAVHSGSGRAARFAESHDVAAVAGSLRDALVDADVVITCRGVGTPVLTVPLVAEAMDRRGGRPLTVVDLALARDVEPAVGDLDGVTLIDLALIQRHVPEASVREVERARELVASGVNDLIVKLKGRQMDPAVVALRDTVKAMVADEVSRLPQGRPVTSEEAEHALHRLAARLIHVPSVRARKAAEEDREDVYLAALSEVYGIEADVRRPAGVRDIADGRPGRDPLVEVVSPDTLEEDACPVTGLDLRDLGDVRRRKAV
ncbi:glutamyl-tRNA reductase [Nigerium massiliense]|uniref:glutamyl-tRNA reductase n=1 Tax=Nigerium massiliense TaxID=1522317 RepID=UPI0006938DC8|nr:glutamyl-tRNA reductase [Nigerium massiliense]